VLLATEDGLVHEISESGITETWSVLSRASKLVYGSDQLRIAVVDNGTSIVHLVPDNGGEVRSLREYGSNRQIIELVQYDHIESDLSTLAALWNDGKLEMLWWAGTSILQERWTLDLADPAGGMAIADLLETRDSALMVPVIDGLNAFWVDGLPVAGWPPAPGGRASEEPPAVIGTPLTLTGGITIGLTESDEVVLFSPAADLLHGPMRQLVSHPISAVTLGGGGSEPLRLIYSEADSLRFVTLGIFGLDGAEPVWAGPGGSASSRGFPLRSREEVMPDDSRAPDALYLYPNPAKDDCTIRAEGFEGELVVRAFTAGGIHLGVVARLGGSTRSAGVVEQGWEISHLAPGVYHLVVEHLDDSESTGQQLVIGRYRLTLLVVR